MTFEQNIKNLLGEYNYQLCAIQQQLFEVTSERDALKAQLREKTNDTDD